MNHYKRIHSCLIRVISICLVVLLGMDFGTFSNAIALKNTSHASHLQPVLRTWKSTDEFLIDTAIGMYSRLSDKGLFDFEKPVHLYPEVKGRNVHLYFDPEKGDKNEVIVECVISEKSYEAVIDRKSREVLRIEELKDGEDRRRDRAYSVFDARFKKELARDSAIRSWFDKGALFAATGDEIMAIFADTPRDKMIELSKGNIISYGDDDEYGDKNREYLKKHLDSKRNKDRLIRGLACVKRIIEDSDKGNELKTRRFVIGLSGESENILINQDTLTHPGDDNGRAAPSISLDLNTLLFGEQEPEGLSTLIEYESGMLEGIGSGASAKMHNMEGRPGYLYLDESDAEKVLNFRNKIKEAYLGKPVIEETLTDGIKITYKEKELERVRRSLALMRGSYSVKWGVKARSKESDPAAPGLNVYDNAFFGFHGEFKRKAGKANWRIHDDGPVTVELENNGIGVIDVATADKDTAVQINTKYASAVIFKGQLKGEEVIIAVGDNHFFYFPENKNEYLKEWMLKNGFIPETIVTIATSEDYSKNEELGNVKKLFPDCDIKHHKCSADSYVNVGIRGYSFINIVTESYRERNEVRSHEFNLVGWNDDEDARSLIPEIEIDPTSLTLTEDIIKKALESVLSEYSLQMAGIRVSDEEIANILKRSGEDRFFAVCLNKFINTNRDAHSSKIYNKVGYHRGQFSDKDYIALWQAFFMIALAPSIAREINSNVTDRSAFDEIRALYWGFSAASRVVSQYGGIAVEFFKDVLIDGIKKEDNVVDAKVKGFIDTAAGVIANTSDSYEGVCNHDTYQCIRWFFGDFSRFPFAFLNRKTWLMTIVGGYGHSRSMLFDDFIINGMDFLVAAEAMTKGEGQSHGSLFNPVEKLGKKFGKNVFVPIIKACGGHTRRVLAHFGEEKIKVEKAEDLDPYKEGNYIYYLARMAKALNENYADFFTYGITQHKKLIKKIGMERFTRIVESAGPGAYGLMQCGLKHFKKKFKVNAKEGDYDDYDSLIAGTTANILTLLARNVGGYNSSYQLFNNVIPDSEVVKRYGVEVLLKISDELGEDIVTAIELFDFIYRENKELLKDKSEFDPDSAGSLASYLVEFKKQSGDDFETLISNGIIPLFKFVRDKEDFDPKKEGSIASFLIGISKELGDVTKVIFCGEEGEDLRYRDNFRVFKDEYVKKRGDLDPGIAGTFAHSIVRMAHAIRPEVEKPGTVGEDIQMIFEHIGKEIPLSVERFGLSDLSSIIDKYGRDGVFIVSILIPAFEYLIKDASDLDVTDRHSLITCLREIYIRLKEEETGDKREGKLQDERNMSLACMALPVLKHLIDKKEELDPDNEGSVADLLVKVNIASKNKHFLLGEVIPAGAKHIKTKKDLDPGQDNSVISSLIDFADPDNNSKFILCRDYLSFMRDVKELAKVKNALRFWAGYAENLGTLLLIGNGGRFPGKPTNML